MPHSKLLGFQSLLVALVRGDLLNQSRGLLFQKFKATRVGNKIIGRLHFFFEGHLLLTALLDLLFCVALATMRSAATSGGLTTQTVKSKRFQAFFQRAKGSLLTSLH